MSHWKKCKVETCIRPAQKKGLCGAHARRLRLQPEVPIRYRPGCAKNEKKIVVKGGLLD
jgi:hypothetical protein